MGLQKGIILYDKKAINFRLLWQQTAVLHLYVAYLVVAEKFYRQNIQQRRSKELASILLRDTRPTRESHRRTKPLARANRGWRQYKQKNICLHILNIIL